MFGVSGASTLSPFWDPWASLGALLGSLGGLWAPLGSPRSPQMSQTRSPGAIMEPFGDLVGLFGLQSGISLCFGILFRRILGMPWAVF